MTDHLRTAQLRLSLMHFFCAAALFINRTAAAFTRQTYIQNFLMMCSVFIYNYAVYESWFDVQL
jgi:hypothetical protein